jgi:hypothetical protein
MSCFVSVSRSPRSAVPARSSRAMRATSVSVTSPGRSSSTSFTRHTSFGTKPTLFREPRTYPNDINTPTILNALFSSTN